MTVFTATSVQYDPHTYIWTITSILQAYLRSSYARALQPVFTCMYMLFGASLINL